MNRQVPTLGKLLTMVIFALSCFGLTLFLWLQFGGSVPFKAAGYRIKTSFPEATSLATQADVRIAGVGVGRVEQVTPGADGRAQVVFEVNRKFAPLPQGTKAILAQKTLLGETYIALTPPDKPNGKVIAEGGRIPVSDVGSTVELDEVFSTFNPETRKYFQTWLQQGGKGLDGQGSNAGKALDELQLLVSDLKDVTGSLNEQAPSLRVALRDGTTVLNSATAQRGALTRAIQETERVFKQTGDQDAALTAFIQKLPKFLKSTKDGTKALETFARQTGGDARNLEPTAKALAPAARSLARVAPRVEQLLVGVERVNAAAKKGLPATETTLQSLPALLDGLDPFLKQLNPIVAYAGLYTDQITGAIGNLAAVTNTSSPLATSNYLDGSSARYLRAGVVVTDDGLTASGKRLSTGQANAYKRPNFAERIGQGLAYAYSRQSCGTTVPRIPDTDNAILDEKESTRDKLVKGADNTLIDALRYSLFAPYGAFAAEPTGTTPSQVPAPTTPLTAPADCTVQGGFTTSGALTTFPQLPAAASSTDPPLRGN